MLLGRYRAMSNDKPLLFETLGERVYAIEQSSDRVVVFSLLLFEI
ncbi:MAG: hypothetical protein V7L00_26035 [Nostoc sp.]